MEATGETAIPFAFAAACDFRWCVTKRSSGKTETGKILVGNSQLVGSRLCRALVSEKMPTGERLGWYAQHFEMVELNATFIPCRTREWWNGGARRRRMISRST